MPIDPHGMDEDDLGAQDEAPRRKYTDFDCPECNANNPVDDPLEEGAEVRCFYCGEEFKAHLTGEGRLKLRLV